MSSEWTDLLRQELAVEAAIETTRSSGSQEPIGMSKARTPILWPKLGYRKWVRESLQHRLRSNAAADFRPA